MNEIEDVVSSVRRLVSPEARPRQLSRDLGLEKLILTPALRVVPEPKPVVKSKAKAAVAPRDSRKTETPKPDPIRVEAAATVVEAEWEAPFWTDPEPALAEMALQAEEAVVVTSPESEVVAAPVPMAKKPAAMRKSPAGKAAAATPLPAVAKPALQAIKAASKPRKTVAKLAPVAARAVLELVRSEPEMTATAPPLAVPDPVVVERAANPVDLVADLQVETVAKIAAPTAVEEELMVNGLAQVLTDRDGNPVSLLDEAELIGMVRRVIREELQDVLGERITRNVRKLVRAEINRALTAQTLE